MNIEIEIFVMEKILFCSVMSYWPAIEKLINSGTYLLRKKLIPKTLQKHWLFIKNKKSGISQQNEQDVLCTLGTRFKLNINEKYEPSQNILK